MPQLQIGIVSPTRAVQPYDQVMSKGELVIIILMMQTLPPQCKPGTAWARFMGCFISLLLVFNQGS